ncbi:MAG: formylglycine-generating enzyme family protein [bacterium]|nr:formylglycine-generating enzyme family protein [bacterium]
MRCAHQRVLFALLLLGLSAADRSAAQPAPARPGDTDRGRLEFVFLPVGSFLMGSPDYEWGSRNDEQQHPVTITRRFFLGKYEVTQAQWMAITGSNPSFLYDCPDCPVENITWFEAVNFCNALSKTLGFEPAYTIRDTLVAWNPAADGIRLPTEAEWEYACRAGTGSVFNTGDCLTTDQANYLGYDPQKGCSKGLWRGQAVEVGGFPANAWELHDMHGNVSEWCWDRHAFPGSTPVVDPRGPDTGPERVIRGGNWHELGRNCRSATRQKAFPDQRFTHVGLRLARSAPKDMRQ